MVATTVKSEKITIVFRLISLATSLLSIGVVLGWIPAENLQAILDVTNSESFREGVGALGIAITMLMPAIQGWRSKDKELPPGLTTDNVILVPKPVEQEKGNDQ